MTNLFDIEGRYSDRRGCGDELYLDSRMKSALMFAELYGTTNVGWDSDSDDEDFNDTSNH